ncbi:hypothetical protein FHR92_004181 [Fontibacillus solani]|uniref:Amidohydrolase-related domain-containing protein n=1 Tax=Fontibacillus solani TaxID=1572857 RepID=A0A7W3XTK5_9BACL|nr:hypothetical protein [Fontibacillus solani]
MNVPIYLHPTIPPKSVQELYYGGLDPVVSARFATAGWGWHNETGIHLLRMILAGVFDKYPQLQIILGHWGEMIPSYLERANDVINPMVKNLKREVSDYFLDHVYVTPSGMFSLPSFSCGIGMEVSEHKAIPQSYKEEKNRLLELLAATDAGTGMMHEGFHADDPGKYTKGVVFLGQYAVLRADPRCLRYSS